MKVQVLDTSALVEFLVGSDTLPEDEATRALDLLGCMQLHRYDHTLLMPRIWELRHNMSPYDASYIALAETLDTELVTADRKVAGATGLRCTVTDLRGDQGLR
ncbi:type II toxin-antitoxin system VapC family toxin [Streptomyces microflavus]|uniref:type II toxin-antitoxin system VapC family toxin n=1 Tax=Streptomyces microflavus TaxID=1919 RepID=UPI0036A139A6